MYYSTLTTKLVGSRPSSRIESKPSIRSRSLPNGDIYVNTEANPADYASRGLRPDDKFEIEQWINGPNFLYDDEENWPEIPEGIKVLNEHLLEWKRNIEVFEAVTDEVKPLDTFTQHYSSWYRLLKGIAWLMRFILFVRRQHTTIRADNDSGDAGVRSDATGAGAQLLTVDELENAQIKLISYIQRQCFPEEIACRTKPHPTPVKKSSRPSKLSPFMGKEGLLRVGGRIDRASISFDSRHPVIILASITWLSTLSGTSTKEMVTLVPVQSLRLYNKSFGLSEVAHVSAGSLVDAFNAARNTPHLVSKSWLRFPRHESRRSKVHSSRPVSIILGRC